MIFLAAPAPAPIPTGIPSAQPPWMNNTNGFGSNHSQPAQNNTFVSDSNFSNVFGNNDGSGMTIFNLPFLFIKLKLFQIVIFNFVSFCGT